MKYKDQLLLSFGETWAGKFKNPSNQVNTYAIGVVQNDNPVVLAAASSSLIGLWSRHWAHLDNLQRQLVNVWRDSHD